MLADSGDTVYVNLGIICISILKFSHQIVHNFSVKLIGAGDSHISDTGNGAFANCSTRIFQQWQESFLDIYIVKIHYGTKTKQ